MSLVGSGCFLAFWLNRQKGQEKVLTCSDLALHSPIE